MAHSRLGLAGFVGHAVQLIVEPVPLLLHCHLPLHRANSVHNSVEHPSAYQTSLCKEVTVRWRPTQSPLNALNTGSTQHEEHGPCLVMLTQSHRNTTPVGGLQPPSTSDTAAAAAVACLPAKVRACGGSCCCSVAVTECSLVNLLLPLLSGRGAGSRTWAGPRYEPPAGMTLGDAEAGMRGWWRVLAPGLPPFAMVASSPMASDSCFSSCKHRACADMSPACWHALECLSSAGMRKHMLQAGQLARRGRRKAYDQRAVEQRAVKWQKNCFSPPGQVLSPCECMCVCGLASWSQRGHWVGARRDGAWRVSMAIGLEPGGLEPGVKA